MRGATSKPWAGWCNTAVFVQCTCLRLVGFVSKGTGFWWRPLNSARALASNAGEVISSTSCSFNLSAAFVAVLRPEKLNGTRPNMYCVGSLDTSTHSNFSAPTVSPLDWKEYWMTFGSTIRTCWLTESDHTNCSSSYGCHSAERLQSKKKQTRLKLFLLNCFRKRFFVSSDSVA